MRAQVLVGVAILILLGLTGVLAAAETAFTRMTRAKASALVEARRPGAGRLLALLEAPERTLNVLLLLVLVTTLSIGTLVARLAEAYGALGLVLGTLAEAAIVFIFAECAPKTFAVTNPEATALRLAPLVSVLTSFPPLRGLARILVVFARKLIPGGNVHGPAVSEFEIRALADAAAAEASIEGEERSLIHSVFAFGDALVREVMVPRTEVVGVEARMSVAEVIECVLSSGFSRLLVYEESLDDPRGVIHLHDLVRVPRRNVPVSGVMRPLRFVPESKRAAELLREMQRGKFSLALVADEYGGTAGIVTLEDLLEEIVGDIADEHRSESPDVEHLPDGRVRFDGGSDLDELAEVLGVLELDGEPLALEGVHTLGGLAAVVLGRIPRPEDVIELDGGTLHVERMEGRRCASLILHLHSPLT